ncbi:MAG: RhuM family protein [Immundisolibacter sp.]|uniref:RhuM family protein n=1 Tax=Immundisolibacter sp. TaxID=1934948 RepID=UPI003EE286F1
MITGPLTLRDWGDKLDTFLAFNEREVLTHAGKLRADVAEKLALERYESFDAARDFFAMMHSEP